MFQILLEDLENQRPAIAAADEAVKRLIAQGVEDPAEGKIHWQEHHLYSSYYRFHSEDWTFLEEKMFPKWKEYIVSSEI